MQYPQARGGGQGTSPTKLHALTGQPSSSLSPQLQPLDDGRRSPPPRYDAPPSAAKYRASLPTIVEPDGISASAVSGAPTHTRAHAHAHDLCTMMAAEMQQLPR